MGAIKTAPSGPMHFLKGLSKKTWMIIGGVAAVVIVVAVVVPVKVTEENAYPSYTAINYTLSETYSGETFFDQFDYFTAADPTEGYVTYVDADTASSLNLTYASSTRAVLRVDTSDAEDTSTDTSVASSSAETTTSTSSTSNTNQNGQSSGQQQGTAPSSNTQQGGPGRRQTTTATSSTGRNSVRVTSKNTYDSGLFIFDVYHTPHGCGTWPALWLTDVDNWPANGEIDVMEAVNIADTGNQMTLHTADDCKMDHKRKQTGTTTYENCEAYANDMAGCGVIANETTYGEAYNDQGGGIMALEWRSAGIRVWNFLRASVPADITSGSPDPSTWGKATADFPNTGCDIEEHFSNQTIIINISLCGTWAGGDAYTESTCPSNCTDFVANNPSNFTDAYWEFGSFQVYLPTSST